MDPEEDLENVVIKIPRSTAVMTDPSEFSIFISGLLLEEDESRLESLGPIEAAKRTTARIFESLEGILYQQKVVEASQRRIQELEKSNTALRKELVESRAGREAAERECSEAKLELRSSEATLKVEREISDAEIETYKATNEALKKERLELENQLLEISFEAMLKERSSLMKQYLSGEYKSWDPEKWIKKYARVEAGLTSSSDEGEREDDGEGDVAKGEEQQKQVEDEGGEGEAGEVAIMEGVEEAPAVGVPDILPVDADA